MAKKRYFAEQVIGKLREAEIPLAKGQGDLTVDKLILQEALEGND